MKIILLQGPSNCGKTETFIKLREKLLNDYHGEELYHSENKRDFESVIKCNEKQIGLFSMGDLKWWINWAVVKYAGVDVLVIAESNHFADSLLNEEEGEFNLELHYPNHKNEQPPCHKRILMEKVSTDELNSYEEAKCKEILAELKKSI